MAFHADPDAALRGLEEPVLLDEWQAVPEVLAAVKRAVDREARAGRFVLTGSVRADLQAETWPWHAPLQDGHLLAECDVLKGPLELRDQQGANQDEHPLVIGSRCPNRGSWARELRRPLVLRFPFPYPTVTPADRLPR